jgi:tetratricopeptide (TPR) repeat protein
MGGNAASEPVGSIELALAHALQLLERDPALAAEQAGEILKSAPGHPNALLVLAIARRAGGDSAASLQLLEGVLARRPGWGAAHYERARTLGELGRGEEAIKELRTAVRVDPDLPDAWRSLADYLSAMGDEVGADQARARFLKASTRDPRLVAAGAALCENRIPEAEALLRRHLFEHPTDIAAIRMFAEVAARLGRYQDAEHLLARCLELAPAFHGARHNYAVALLRQGKHAAALREIEPLLAAEPRNPNYRSLQAAILGGIGEYARALAIYDEILKEYPTQARVWMSYGHALKTAGRAPEGVRAYRRTLELDPGLGEAWWSLANLKTYRFDPPDLALMRAQLERTDLQTEDRFHFHFALGKTLEDQQDYRGSFEHYRRGNALRRAQVHYETPRMLELVARTKAFFTPELFAARAGQGAPAADAIFIVGLPRAGSTLIEQILASHSQVEGTMELADLPAIAQQVGAHAADAVRYPEALASLDAAQLRALGEEYLERTRIQRKTGRAFFIDKLPNNFLHTGLIHLILPNARIIDARRHPLGCCFSAFKQHFARGQNYTYDLGELGTYYRAYVELMAHIDAVLPGRVHRVLYERMIEDTEGEVRRLLDYCGLPFEADCLRFYENERAVRTASSEQVRSPIYREGMDQWRPYEPWLEPLKSALGPVIDAYPLAPDFGANQFKTTSVSKGENSCSAADHAS